MADPSDTDAGSTMRGCTSRRLLGSGDVLFDDHHAWSFMVKGRRSGRRGRRGDLMAAADGPLAQRLVASPRRREATRDLLGEVVFGDGDGRVAFVDQDGIPSMIDKWGLLQRPFSGRDPEVLAQMVEMTDEILDVMEPRVRHAGWIAFGTLLGAAREGQVIGHDSDIDLAYLSEQDDAVGDGRRAVRRWQARCAATT